jgi:hypothetical protein
LIARGPFEEAVQESPEIKASAPGEHRQASSRRYIGDRFAGEPGIFAGREQLIGIDDIDEVVWNATPLPEGQFGGSDVKEAEDLERVAIDDLTVEFRRDFEGQITFPRTGRTSDRNQGPLRCVIGVRTIFRGLFCFSSPFGFRILVRELRYTIKV